METKKSPHNIFRNSRPKERCSRYKKTGALSRPGVRPSTAFLKHAFQPVVKDAQLLENWKAKERSFFHSFANLADYFKFVPENFSQVPYPLNVYFAYKHAASCLNASAPGVNLILSERSADECCLTTIEEFSIENTLFYVPLHPVYRMVLRKESDTLSILLPICCYLSKVVHFPSYLDNGAVGWYYSQLINQFEYEDDEDGVLAAQDAADAIAHGKKLMKIINRMTHLKHWSEYLDKFEDKTAAVWKLSASFYDLYKRFPNHRIDQNIYQGFDQPDADERGYLDQYASFVWEDNARYADDLEEYMSTWLGECMVMDVPVKLTFFDSMSPKPTCTLDFETALFNLLRDFSYLLYNIP